MSILQFRDRGGHHESPVTRARYVVQAYVAQQANDGHLHAIADNMAAIALYLAVDVLQEYADHIKLSMIERWIMEAVSSHQQTQETTSVHPTITGQLIHDAFEAVVCEGSRWSDLRPIDRDVYERMAVRLMGELNLCFYCGTQTDPSTLFVVEGKHICQNCLHRREERHS